MGNLLRILFVCACTAVLGIIGMTVGVFDRSGEFLVWIGRVWSRWILAVCGVRVVVEGTGNVDPSEPHIFMANHQSLLDIPAIVTTIPVSYRFVAKRELTRIPIFGWAMVVGGHVVIDRANRSSAVKVLGKAAAQVRGGTNVIVFPEGTRSETGEMRDFKSGGFHLAIDSGVSIVPVSVSGSRQITPKKSTRIHPGVVKIVYGRPIPVAGLGKDGRHQLKEKVRAAILAGLDPELQRPEHAPLGVPARSGVS